MSLRECSFISGDMIRRFLQEGEEEYEKMHASWAQKGTGTGTEKHQQVGVVCMNK